jgi:prepilin-type processing-associated H-X9-DG protein
MAGSEQDRLHSDNELPPSPSSKANLITWTVAVSVILILFGMLLPTCNAAREKARRASCMCSIKQLGLSIRLYSGDNKGRFPTDASWTVLGSYALLTNFYQTSWSTWICPSDNCGPGGCGFSLRSVHNPFFKTNISYAYGGFGMTENVQPDTPILADRTSGDIRSKTPYMGNTRTHKQDGGDVLFADGHVEWTATFSPPMYRGKNP